MNLDALKPGDDEPTPAQDPANEPNPPAEPAYSAPRPNTIVLPEEADEPDVFDEEAGIAADLEPDFEAEETNAKESGDGGSQENEEDDK